jgi:hypothetical protein
MASNPAWEICERMAEVQALLHDHAECGKHTAADAVAKAQVVLSEPELLRAMFDVGYFPPNTPRSDRTDPGSVDCDVCHIAPERVLLVITHFKSRVV